MLSLAYVLVLAVVSLGVLARAESARSRQCRGPLPGSQPGRRGRGHLGRPAQPTERRRARRARALECHLGARTRVDRKRARAGRRRQRGSFDAREQLREPAGDHHCAARARRADPASKPQPRREHPRHGGARPAPGSTVGAGRVTQSVAAVQSAVRSTVAKLALVAGTVLLLGLLAGGVIARQVALPLRRLEGAARRLAGGDLSARAVVEEAPYSAR